MVTDARLERFRTGLLSWAAEGNLRDFPCRETDSPYEVVVAEVLLGATLASKVEPIYREFVSSYPDFTALHRASEAELASLLEPLGLHVRRAAAFIKSLNGWLAGFENQR